LQTFFSAIIVEFDMKKFKQIIALVAASSIFSGAAVALADESKELGEPGFHHHFKNDDGADAMKGHGRKEHGFREHGRLPLELLNLTDLQKQTLKTARAERRPAMKELHKKLRATREALDKAGDQNADDATLNRLASDLASIIAQQEVARIKIHREFLNVLTPEQQEKLAAFEADRKSSARWKNRERNEDNDKQKNTSSKSATKS
jgi:Spy/CpxP family protein refolding chaperone